MCAGKSVTCALISPFVPRTCPISMGGPSSSASQIAVEKGAGARHVPRQEGCAFTVSVLQHARGSAAAVCQPVGEASPLRLGSCRCLLQLVTGSFGNPRFSCRTVVSTPRPGISDETGQRPESSGCTACRAIVYPLKRRCRDSRDGSAEPSRRHRIAAAKNPKNGAAAGTHCRRRDSS